MFHIGIDPGLTCTAYAVIDDKGMLKHYNSFKPTKEKNPLEFGYYRIKRIFGLTIIPFNSVVSVFIEGVSTWQMSLTSQTATNKGDLYKLAYLIGVYYAALILFTERIEIVLPNQWKGQLPKKEVERRVRIAFPKLGMANEHEIDAIGIALWSFKNEKMC